MTDISARPPSTAGVGAAQIPLHVMTDELYDTIMDTNVRGVWNCMRHQIRVMLLRGGAIVNMSSTAGLVATPVAAPYIASKHAVLGLTKAAAAEYAAHGIRINAIAPGSTHSEMIDAWLQQEPGARELLLNAAPLPHIAEPGGGGRGGRLAVQRPGLVRGRGHLAGRRRLDGALTVTGVAGVAALPSGQADAGTETLCPGRADARERHGA